VKDVLRFTVKFLLLISTLLFGILLGIQQAEEGIFQLQGLAKEDRPSFFITRIDDDQVETEVLNSQFSVAELEEKQEKWQERTQRHRWSEVGHQLGDLVYSLSRRGADWFVRQLDRLL
jgi:hypothetical protein